MFQGVVTAASQFLRQITILLLLTSVSSVVLRGSTLSEPFEGCQTCDHHKLAPPAPAFLVPQLICQRRNCRASSTDFPPVPNSRTPPEDPRGSANETPGAARAARLFGDFHSRSRSWLCLALPAPQGRRNRWVQCGTARNKPNQHLDVKHH